MGKRIDFPPTPVGTAQEQMRQMYSYLYMLAQTLNNNLAETGGMDLTDEERAVMLSITKSMGSNGLDESGSLKGLIIKTAEYVQKQLKEYKANMLGVYVEDGKFAKYVKSTGLNVDVTPAGDKKEISLEKIVQDLKTDEMNARNYIYTGVMRTVGGVPVYGAAIGKDVLTFDTDGTATYHPENRVAELTADGIIFLQGGSEVMSVQYDGANKKTRVRFKCYDPDNSITVFFPIDIDADANEVVIGDQGGILNGTKTTYIGDEFSGDKFTGDTFTGDTFTGDSFLPAGSNSTVGASDDLMKSVYSEYVYYTYLVENSSREVKHDIRPMVSMGEKLDRLRPVTFVYNRDAEERTRYGLIYEDTVGVLPEICTEENAEKAINYTELIMMLLKEAQELRARVKALEEKAKED